LGTYSACWKTYFLIPVPTALFEREPIYPHLAFQNCWISGLGPEQPGASGGMPNFHEFHPGRVPGRWELNLDMNNGNSNSVLCMTSSFQSILIINLISQEEEPKDWDPSGHIKLELWRAREEKLYFWKNFDGGMNPDNSLSCHAGQVVRIYAFSLAGARREACCWKKGGGTWSRWTGKPRKFPSKNFLLELHLSIKIPLPPF